MPDLIKVRNVLNDFGYSKIAKPILFMFDPELMHKTFIVIGKILDFNILSRKIVGLCFDYGNGVLEQKILGIRFRNPIGLSAGFDKNAELIGLMKEVGFGFSEAGSITAKESKGNIGKRMRREIKEKSLWVNLGLNNRGADITAENLRRKRFSIPFGINIAKTNCRETADSEIGLKDYLYSLNKLRHYGDYFVLNISCPNAFGGQPFSNPGLYEKLLKGIDRLGIKKPIFVKLSPDLTKKNVDDILRISGRHKIAGFICTNLTKNGKTESGGFSGKMVEKKADEMLKYVYKKTKGDFILIGVGGVFSAEDAYKKIRLGASLVQLFTGMIYEGPGLIGEINYGLVRLLKRDGFENVGEAVGADVK